MGKNILVTGGLGFIGSHTVVALHEAGFNPVIVDNLSNSRRGILDHIEHITGERPKFYEEDVINTVALEDIIEEEEIDAVIHFAAFKSVSESLEHPLVYYDNNVGGLLSLLNAMKFADCKHLVFSSSCTVYGEPDIIPVDEQSPVKQAKTAYGSTKQVAEIMLRDNTWLNTIALRYFNPVGGHESGMLGELPLGVPKNLMPYLTQTAAGIRDQLTVFGDDYDTRDGSCIRDFIHVMDLAEAHVKAVERLLDGDRDTTQNIYTPDTENFEAINVGTGNGYTVLEIIKKFEEVNGIRVNYKIGPRRDGDIVRIWADTTKSYWRLGWQAKRGLVDMVRDSWAWQRNLPGKDLFNPDGRTNGDV
jgi:UDP-glucose 4-epimerase